MEIGKTLYVKNRKEWRGWLKGHTDKENEIWLIYYKVGSGKPRIPYNDAVEEALCFGWIDSTVKSIDAEKYAQRFSPRRKGSVLSEPNKVRIRKLIAEGMMTEAGLKAVAHAFNEKTDGGFKIAKDILDAIRRNRRAWGNFRRLPENYRRIRIAYIESQRDHNMAAFNRSLNNFIRKTEKNKRFGFVRE